MAETSAEVEAGFMTGPRRSEQEVSALLGTEHWSLSPMEDSKVRVIDDLKASAVNQAFSSSSYLDLQDTDFTVGLLRFISRSLQVLRFPSWMERSCGVSCAMR